MLKTINNSVLFIGACIINIVVGFSGNAESIGFNELLKQPRPVTAPKHIAYGQAPDQFGELWLPDKPGPYPVIIMIHGGCWMESVPGFTLMSGIAEDMRKSGIAVWNIEYRRLSAGNVGYPDTFLDIAHGVDYLRNISKTYSLDISRVVVLGHSAGGHLALWTAARGHIKSSSKIYIANPLPVKAAVSLAGINDLKAFAKTGRACGGHAIIEQLTDSKNRTGENPYADTSPAAMLPIGVEQLVVSGALDSIIPAELVKDYSNLAQATGDKIKYLEIKNSGHFEVVSPASEAWSRIKSYLLLYIQAK